MDYQLFTTEQASGNDQFLDFVCAFVNLGDFCVAHHAFYMIFVHVAVAAEHLYAFCRDFHGDVGAGKFRYGCGCREGLAFFFQASCLVEDKFRFFDVSVEFGHFECQILLLEQGLAKLFPFLEVFDGDVKRTFGDAESLRADADAAAVEGFHGQFKAFARFGDHAVCRYADVGEDHFGNLGGTDAHLIFYLADVEAFHALFDDEGAHALRADRRVGQGVDDSVVSQGAVGIENLRTVEDIVVAVLCGNRFLSCRVGTGRCFGEAEGTDGFAAGDRREETFFLVFSVRP